MNDVTSGEFRALLGISREALSGLAKKGVAVRGDKRGTYRLEMVTRYREHLHQRTAFVPLASTSGGPRFGKVSVPEYRAWLPFPCGQAIFACPSSLSP